MTAEPDVELSAGARRFDWLVQSLLDCAVALVDATGRVLSWNRGAQLIAGYSPREAIGTCLNRCCGLDVAAWRAESEALATGLRAGPLEINGWRTRKDGSKYWSNAVLAAVARRRGRKNEDSWSSAAISPNANTSMTGYAALKNNSPRQSNWPTLEAGNET